MSKPTKRFVLVPADAYFTQREERVTNPGLMSITSPPESKKAKFSEQDLKLELIKQNCEQFRGTKNADAIHYKPFGLQRLEITRGNGVPVPGSPLDMRNGKIRAYYNTICSLGFAAGKGGNGIAYKNFDDHFVLVFNLI